ncbi:permease prefix domain 1-containing protein [Pseudoflavonifractor phocaeensis]|uniref:permease prefix domain 1-containing protein n=1 Tax=Pseudoflavonifractor phocaeensis TaxID=1870988 RepID=UPI0025A3511C|nr:permease prefix domain 1-containing protein [Pseudoflavonifractor phocaeensis]MDM8237760.1 permease prefix domain 1-containing protein [Pseudoflavonifractor phocaeensis]
MSECNTIQAYLDAVAEQIRWKRAKPVVLAELEQHLEDQRDTFASEGCANAEQLAVEEMGDPVSVGTELDRIHRPKPQWGLLTLTVLLALAGAVLRVVLTADWSVYGENFYLRRTVLAFVLGCGALLLGYFLNYVQLGRWGRALYFVGLVVGIWALTRSPGISGRSYYTSYVTLCYPVVYVFWLNTWRRKGWMGLTAALLGGIPLGMICMFGPHMFSLVMLFVVGTVSALLAAWNDWFGMGRQKSVGAVLLWKLAVAGVTAGSVFLSGDGFRRLAVVLHPERDPMGSGYQASMIRQALETAQWVGAGEWSIAISGRPYETTVPGCDGSALLTTLIYKLGWLPFLAVVLVFGVLVVWMLSRCLRQKSQLGKMVVLAVFLTLSGQAVCSVAWNLGFTLYSSEFPLLIGNLSSVVNMGLIGLALSVFRGENIAQNPIYNELPHLLRYRVRIILGKCE